MQAYRKQGEIWWGYSNKWVSHQISICTFVPERKEARLATTVLYTAYYSPFSCPFLYTTKQGSGDKFRAGGPCQGDALRSLRSLYGCNCRPNRDAAIIILQALPRSAHHILIRYRVPDKVHCISQHQPSTA